MLSSSLLPTQIENIVYAISGHFLRVPQGISPADLMQPNFWVHLARRFKVNDKIEAVADDGSFDMEMRVVALDPRGLWAQVRVLRICSGEGVTAFGVVASSPANIARRWPDEDGYTVEFSEPQRWRIIDRVGNSPAWDFPDEKSAIAALAELKAPRRKPEAAPEKRDRKEKATGDYRVGWAGPFHKFTIYGPDGKAAAKGFAKREEAEEALENLRSVKAAA